MMNDNRPRPGLREAIEEAIKAMDDITPASRRRSARDEAIERALIETVAPLSKALRIMDKLGHFDTAGEMLNALNIVNSALAMPKGES